MNLPAPQAVKFLDLGSQYNLDHIDSSHFDEWVVDSGVDPEIVAANVVSLSGDAPYDYLLYSDNLPRRNDGRVVDWVLRRYKHVEDGGWWCSGEDLVELKKSLVDRRINQRLDDFIAVRMLWGQFKPNTPAFDEQKNRPLKYEAPPKTETRAYALSVPSNPRYWLEVLANPAIPIIITEGAKKAGILMSLGYTTIALPGVFSGYRKSTQKLIDDLAVVCAKGRPIYICFDHDTKEETRRNVNLAISKLGKLFSLSGCTVRVIDLPGPEKGVDEFIVARGKAAFDACFESALPLYQWQTKLYSQLTYEPSLSLDQEKLGPFCILGQRPKLECFRSPKGSGKTYSLKQTIAEAKARGQRVLLITHRVQLGQDICQKVGIPYVTEAGITIAASPGGYGLCIDSLHPESQARFNAEDWQDAIIIIDEAEQVIWHLLDANTEVREHRLVILEQLQQLFIQTFQSDNGKVVLLDADLTDVAINFVLNLAEARLYIKPFIVANRYHNPDKRICYHYDQSTPKAWLASLMQAVSKGERLVVVTQSQKAKSVWSARNLEQLILKFYPDKKILRVDSETIADPSHPAYGVVEHLNEDLKKYDIVLATPTIETGVSIEIYGHFDSVWGCFWGVSSSNSARQALARVRDDIPRHVWAVNHATGKVANGATSKYGLRNAQVKVAQAAIARLSAWWEDDDGYKTNEVALHTWSEMACRINAERHGYRAAIADGLKAEGYEIRSGDLLATDALIDWASEVIDPEFLDSIEYPTPDFAQLGLIKFFVHTLKTIRDHEYGGECTAEEQTDLVSDTEGEELRNKRNKTLEERLRYRKWKRHKKYGGIPVTVDLIQKDDNGWFPQLQLAYYLSLGQKFVKERDAKILSSSARNGKLWYPTFGKSQIGTIAELFKLLKIDELQKPEREYSNTDEDMIDRAQMARTYAEDIKALTGITIAEKDTPIAIANKFLKKLDLKLTRYRRTGANGAPRPWVYVFISPNDERSEVFERWLERDTLSRNEFVVSPEFLSNNLSQEAA